MRITIALLAMLLSFTASATDKKKTVKVYEVNRYGQTQYSKPIKIQNNKVTPVNRYGQTQHHKAMKIVK